MKRRTAVILAVGQSNIANEGDPDGHYAPDVGVYNFNFLDGRIYVAKDPLLGATLDRSNVLTRIGDLLVRHGYQDKVLLAPIAYGGSFMSWWAPGGVLSPRLLKAIRGLARIWIAPTHILLQQGEAEANHQPNDESATEWVANFQAMVSLLRKRGLDAPIYVAQSTVCHGNPSEIIRAAQRSVVSISDGVYPGPDLDGIMDRWDGCHFSTLGMKKAAELWVDAITK